MATYAIGDLQGCYAPLQRLLKKCDFDSSADTLWFVGDLVNRGPDSLDVLRFVKSLGERTVVVLGNHDLHLLTVAAGFVKPHRSDTLDEILNAPDCEELLAWLRHRPILHRDLGYTMIHAGLLPSWTIHQAQALAIEVESALRGPHHLEFLANLYGNQPNRWRDDLMGWDRLRIIVNAFTRLRICTPDGELEYSHKGEIADIPAGYLPWSDAPGRRSANETIICGHWSAQGLRLESNLLALDTGCLWGQCLSAVRLEDRGLFQVACSEFSDSRMK
jgi:bis(5'-nucleosyl)-tetraphosphatase (symmetrical)